jgi:hypothetical protein
VLRVASLYEATTDMVHKEQTSDENGKTFKQSAIFPKQQSV